jgi:hypothetical protein
MCVCCSNAPSVTRFSPGVVEGIVQGPDEVVQPMVEEEVSIASVDPVEVICVL